MAYQSIQLDQELFVSDIYTIHYYEYRNDFHFDGERHDFWEFQCVDKGIAEVITDNGTYTLTRSQVIFHRPNEFHTLKANARIFRYRTKYSGTHYCGSKKLFCFSPG